MIQCKTYEPVPKGWIVEYQHSCNTSVNLWVLQLSFSQGLCQWEEADVSQPGLRGTNQYWIQPSELAADLCDNKDLTDCVEHRAEQQQIYSVASVSQGCLAAAITHILI